MILDMFAGCWIRAEQCVIKYYIAVCFLVAPGNPYTKALLSVSLTDKNDVFNGFYFLKSPSEIKHI